MNWNNAFLFGLLISFTVTAFVMAACKCGQIENEEVSKHAPNPFAGGDKPDRSRAVGSTSAKRSTPTSIQLLTALDYRLARHIKAQLAKRIA